MVPDAEGHLERLGMLRAARGLAGSMMGLNGVVALYRAKPHSPAGMSFVGVPADNTWAPNGATSPYQPESYCPEQPSSVEGPAGEVLAPKDAMRLR